MCCSISTVIKIYNLYFFEACVLIMIFLLFVWKESLLMGIKKKQ